MNNSDNKLHLKFRNKTRGSNAEDDEYKYDARSNVKKKKQVKKDERNRVCSSRVIEISL